jgi:hypothetical protein
VGAVAAAAMLGLSTALSLAAIARTLAITRSIA